MSIFTDRYVDNGIEDVLQKTKDKIEALELVVNLKKQELKLQDNPNSVVSNYLSGQIDGLTIAIDLLTESVKE